MPERLSNAWARLAWARLAWAIRRVGRMSPPEIGHRVVEQLKRACDRFSRPEWSSFGGAVGAIRGLPGLRLDAAADPAFRARLAVEARATLAGRFTFLGQAWPSPDAADEPWWRGAVWLVDPATSLPWPGEERFAFDVGYRHGERGDVKFVWELNRLQILPPLALQAALTGDAVAAERVYDILKGWMRANPPRRGVNWTSGVEAASRVVSILAALALAPPSTTEDGAAVRAFLDGHGRWIARYPSRFSSANNHRIAEAAALFLIGVCAPDWPQATAWSRWARGELEREALRQILPDGAGAEQSTGYAAYTLEWLTLCGIAGDAAGRPFTGAFRDRLRAAMVHLRWLLDEGGHAPRIGDADDSRILALTQAGEPRYVASVAAMAARWLGDAEPEAGRRDPALRDLIGTPSLTAAPSDLGARTFHQGGMTVWRRARTDGVVMLAFDHGPLGYLSIAAHGHADALSVWLHWGEEAVFIDPGAHLYHSDQAVRDALRGTPVHNTLALGGQDQSRIVGPFAWADHAAVRLLAATEEAAEAEHDGYGRRFGLRHRRRVQVDDDGAILIEDRLTGRAKRPSTPWSLGFTLAPGIAVVLDGPRAELRTPAGRRLVVTAETRAGGWSLAQVPFAPAFGTLKTTLRLELGGLAAAEGEIARVRIALLADAGHQETPR